MGFKAGFSSFLLLEKEITNEQKEKCFVIFMNYNFLALDYKTRKYILFDEVLTKYPNYPEYLLRYKKEDYVFSCQTGDNFLLNRVDRDTEDSKIIFNTTNELCKIINSLSFSYIDNEGSPPKKIESAIKNIEIKWLFKYNYFGKDFIEKYGKDFFINMPCFSQEFINDDIIRIDLCKDLFSPINKTLMKEVTAYLNSFSIKVSFYNHKNFFID